MGKLQKQLKTLSRPDRRKYHFIIQELNGGRSYKDIGGRKLNMPTAKDVFISFRLRHRTRAIVCMDRTGKVNPLFVGSHDEYDKRVGPKAKTRLLGGFR
jgi:hypothetical protein